MQSQGGVAPRGSHRSTAPGWRPHRQALALSEPDVKAQPGPQAGSDAAGSTHTLSSVPLPETRGRPEHTDGVMLSWEGL